MDVGHFALAGALLAARLMLALGAVEPTFEHCCRLGSSGARAVQHCSVSTSPLPGVAADEQAMCASVSAICCTRKLRQMQCSSGTEAAKNSHSCLVNSNEPAQHFYKDCCEGCKLGLVVGQMGMGCDFTRFKLGHPWHNSFTSCCADRSPVGPGVPATRTTAVAPPGSGHIVESDSENICGLFVGQLCAHLCVSIPGSYRCECRPGFVLGPDAKSCTVDASRDRCADDNPCADICTDTGVDIRCSCQEGFQLAPDQVNCLDVDECTSRTHECRPGHMCFNEPGAYGCLDRVTRDVYRPGRPAPRHPPTAVPDTHQGDETDYDDPTNPCPEGFTPNPTSQLCDDIDECADPSSCGDQACQNSVGSYQCIPQINPCPSGFVFNPNLQTCTDINECLEGTSTCESNTEFCVNTQGGFTCQQRKGPQDCPAGFKYSAQTRNCQDVDECTERIDGCGDSEVCRNTVGGYECDITCEAGYSYSVLTRRCVDIDECFEALDDCAPREVCQNEPGTYRCLVRGRRCPPGYRRSLLFGVDCEDIDECAERLDNCTRSDAQTCVNTDGGFNCIIRCKLGFRFSPEITGCADVDECAERLHNCTSATTCVNSEGSFTCRANCPLGYRLRISDGGCDDIDECAEGSHDCRPNQRCTNEPGAFNCVANTTCIDGFQYSYASRNCEDIDECTTGTHGCAHSHRCVNTVGSFSCIARIPSCPSGYQYNTVLRDCVDIDECKEGTDTCESAVEYCVNTVGGFECNKRIDPVQCATGFRLNPATGICEDVDECAAGLHSCRPPLHCVNIRGSFTCSRVATRHNITSSQRCPAGYKFLAGRCRDIDECAEGTHLCNAATERCVNEQGGYRCRESRPPPPSPGGGSTNCDPGYRLSTAFGRCLDVNECQEQRDVCGTHGTCVNTRGSFACQCQAGFKSDKQSKRCTDVNECQLDIHSCVDSQRCDNTIGSFACIRTSGCGTGYTLNSQLGVCEDDDECTLGRDDCDTLGPQWTCHNIEGSFRCVKKRCKYGEKLTAEGRCIRVECRPGFQPDRSGRCIDIDECANDPCGGNFRCDNSPGSFRCTALLKCQRGFQASGDGTICVDIDECSDGTGTCTPDQICTNTPGGYECACQQGYYVNRSNRCEDVDECRTYGDKVCGGTSQCVNTPGSYMCRCSTGYKQGSNPRICVDQDECEERPGICHQKCVNTWGSYKCACNDGYRLHTDGRNCIDVDECEEARQLSYGSLCIGLCVNEPGSFHCQCPQGYVLGPESRQCQDINECSNGNMCGAEEVCLNTRGGFRCNRINCPPGYERDSAHRNRCKRKSLFCQEGDTACLRRPLSYSFNFLTFVSKLPIPRVGRIDLFTMRGPLWSQTTVRFQLSLVTARPGAHGVAQVTDSYFQLRRLQSNQAVVSLVRSVEGPQQIELQLTMDLYQGARFSGKAVAKLFIFVTQYEF